MITGCLKPTNTNSLPVPAGIAPSDIRNQESGGKSYETDTANYGRKHPWTPVCTFISADEHLPAGAENPWTTWKALNRLRTQVGRSRVNMLKRGFSNEQETCDWHQADHATPTGLQHLQHLLSPPATPALHLLSPRPDNG